MKPVVSFSTSKTAILRHLSGSRRGRVEVISRKTIHLIRDTDNDIRILSADDIPNEDWVATLHRSGISYELEIVGDNEVWVNGVRVVDSKILSSGDLLELGHTGPVLRFRLYPPGVTPKKTLAEAFTDSLDGARADGRSNFGKAGWFFTRFAHDLATQTTLWFRLGVLILITLLIVSVIILVVQNYRFQKRLYTEAVRIDSIAEVLEKTGAEVLKKEDLLQIRKEVESRFAEAANRVAILESRSAAVSRTISAVTNSIVLVQGAFGFIDPETGKRLRYLESPEGYYLFTLDEEASLVELTFTGTAFVVPGKNVLMTNKHVAMPWLADDRARIPDEHGLNPTIIKMRIFLPGVDNAVEVEYLDSLDNTDLALLKADGKLNNVPALEFNLKTPQPGDELLVIGYPLGMSGMLARVSPEFVEKITQNSESDFWAIGEELSAGGYIKPLASRGIVSQTSDNYIVFDAETTVGGSGGPILDLDGKVIGVTTAVISGFGGSNLGILSVYANQLLNKAAKSK